METSDLYTFDDVPVSAAADVPEWVEPFVTLADLAAIIEGGCESGAYMPAVVYAKARETMAEHGDDVLDYLDRAHGLDECAFVLDSGQSWDGFACRVLSAAVEAWASEAAHEAVEAFDDWRDEFEALADAVAAYMLDAHGLDGTEGDGEAASLADALAAECIEGVVSTDGDRVLYAAWLAAHGATLTDTEGLAYALAVECLGLHDELTGWAHSWGFTLDRDAVGVPLLDASADVGALAMLAKRDA